MKHIFALCISVLSISVAGYSCSDKKTEAEKKNRERARITLDALYRCYSAPNTNLLRENYPFDEKYTATYLASEEQSNVPNQYSFLWPYSGTFSAVNALMEASGDLEYQQTLDKQVLAGLEKYFDTKRLPHAYASYISSAPASDRFYDDNVWLGIDFTDIYMMTKDKRYLDKAELIWEFILSGTDDILGGGIYWCEQKKESKNTCSNAPGSVYAFKLFEATGDSCYFYKGQELYEWTKKNLQDSGDYLYYDNINLKGEVDKRKYAYNSGQMLQSAALQYKLTGDKKYLTEAQHIAKACYEYFFYDFTAEDGNTLRLLNKGDVWFTAVMLRGFVELYHQDGDKTYLNAFDVSLSYAWEHARDDEGLFSVDFSEQKQDDKKWLLTQAAMVEMYARMAGIE